MPIWRRKRVTVVKVANDLLLSVDQVPPKQVFYLERTGEIFEDYESYSARLSFYRSKHFQCEVTGKGGLDYFQALESELQEGKTLHERFPEALKVHVLRAVQWQIVGRLDHLVESVFERFKDRFFPDEKVLIELQGEKYWARITEVFPPKNKQKDDSPPHYIGCNLSYSAQEAIEQDNPAEYFYKVQLQEEGDASTAQATDAIHLATEGTKWSGSIMDVQSPVMTRDRLTFSKSLLRRFLRDNIDREATVASPWTIKSSVATKYGLDTEMSEQTKMGVESVRKTEMEKRKKMWEDKEGPPTKRQKKTATDEKVKARRKEEENTRVAAEQIVLEKEAAAAAALEAKKKKQLKYPTEDLDVIPSERSKKQGHKIRPCPKRDLPFGDSFEAFLMGWSYLEVFGIPLHLSPFTLDEFEKAVLHSDGTPCSLVAEIHAALVYNIRQITPQRNVAISSLYEHNHELVQSGVDDAELVPIDTLIETLRERGSNWERSPLRSTRAREGWQEAVIGLLKDHATVEAFPRLRQVLTSLLFPDTILDIADDGELSPTVIYNRMPPTDKIALISFLCNCSISSKAIRGYMETCEEQLTLLRKEKTELNRERKKCIEQMNELTESKSPPQEKEGVDDHKGNTENNHDSIPNSNDSGDDGEKSSRSGSPLSNSRNHDSPIPVPPLGSRAAQRQLEREKNARDKAALAEYRRLDEELNKLDRRLEAVDLEFRKLLGTARARPLGKDRFFTRIWWLDGLGGGSLVGVNGSISYGTGRIFIQGPTESDWELMQRREDEEGDVMVRMREDLGDDGVMDIGEWGYYDDVEIVDEFIAWLNHKGKRELHTKNALLPWKLHITNGMRKRSADLAQTKLATSVQQNEQRRSQRQASNTDKEHCHDSYLTWVNRRATTSNTSV